MSEQPQGQQAVSMDDVAGWYGREVSGLMARLVQSDLAVARLTDEANQLRAELRRVQQAATAGDEGQRADPGAFSPPTVIESAV